MTTLLKASLVGISMLLVACNAPQRDHRTTSNDGLYTVTWSTSTGQNIMIDEYFIVRARIDPVPTRVQIDAGMPEHRHGMLHKAQTRRLSHDTWLGSDMLFHMPGLWRLTFDLTDASGTVHRAESDIVLE